MDNIRPLNAPGRVTVKFTGSGRTKQSFAEECDINKLMDRFAKTGQINHQTTATPWYGDFSNVSEYQEAVNLAMNAEEAFSELSAKVRRRFGNDPANLLEFMDDSRNEEEAIKLGLFEAKGVPTPRPGEPPAPEPEEIPVPD